MQTLQSIADEGKNIRELFEKRQQIDKLLNEAFERVKGYCTVLAKANPKADAVLTPLMKAIVPPGLIAKAELADAISSALQAQPSVELPINSDGDKAEFLVRK